MADWLVAVGRGERDALAILYGQTAPRLMAVLVRLLRRRELASGGPKTIPSLLHAENRVAAVNGGHAYLVAGQMQGEALVAVDREKGRYAWHHQPPGGSQASAPRLADGRLFYLSGGRLFCLEPPEAARSAQ